MYWVRGSINFTLTTPGFVQAEDAGHFHEWMEDRGWSFTQLALDPLSEDYSVGHAEGRDKLSSWDAEAAEWELAVNMPRQLMQAYRDFGLVADSGALPLCDHCRHHAACWAGIEQRKPVKPEERHWSHLAMPWVGRSYKTYRIAVIGVNPNEAGGLNLYEELVPAAQAEMLGKGGKGSGRRRVNFGHEGYKGSLLWHRIGLYAAKVIERLAYDDDPLHLPELSHIDAFNRISFINHIKCSPVGDRSEPSRAMWENCSYILRRELQIMQPNILLVLGTGENMRYLLQNVVDADPALMEATRYVRMAEGRLEGRAVGIINVPHPAGRFGASHEIGRELDLVLNRNLPRLQQCLGLPRVRL